MNVCLVALNIYPMLSRDYRSRKVGGAELQQVHIARSLASQGHGVFVVCLDHGQDDGRRIGDVVVLKAFKEDAGIPVLRFFHPRITSLWGALARADCDVYYCRTAGFVPGLLGLFRKTAHRPYVFAGALDTDFVPDLADVATVRDRLLFEFGLRNADRIIVQSDRQRELLATHHGLDGVVVPNFLNEARRTVPAHARRLVLWAATIRTRKQPMHFVRLAARLPNIRFVMAGGPSARHAALYDEVAAAARRVPNLEFLGFQPYERIEALFDRCRVFVNTSRYEGFPNTFLQAWRRDIPVVSFIDPDGIVRKHALGHVVENEEQLAAAVREASASFDRYAHAGEYYLAHHSARTGIELGRILEETAAAGRARARARTRAA